MNIDKYKLHEEKKKLEQNITNLIKEFQEKYDYAFDIEIIEVPKISTAFDGDMPCYIRNRVHIKLIISSIWV